MADSLTACLRSLAAALGERHDLPVIVLPALAVTVSTGLAFSLALPPPAAALPALGIGLGAGLAIRRHCRRRRRELVRERFLRYFPPTDPGTVAVHRRLAELAAADAAAPVAQLARLVGPPTATRSAPAVPAPSPAETQPDHLPLEPESDRFARD